MSHHRFEELEANISFSEIENPANCDCWSEVEGFVEAINHHRCAVDTTFETIWVDESISRLCGLREDWSEIGLPNYVKLERKSESGCELKIACTGISGIMLAIELTKASVEAEA